MRAAPDTDGQGHRAGAAADWTLAFRNAFKVSASLLATWGIALAIRLVLPRYLGPDAFGSFSFADAFSATFFVALAFGVEGYVYRAVSVQPFHASDFFGSVVLLRVVGAAALVVPMTVVLRAMGTPPDVERLVWAFCAANLLVAINATLAAVLQAVSRVDGLVLQNVVSKLLWGAGVAVAIWRRTPLWTLAAPLVASEALKLAALWTLAVRHAGLRFRVDARATARVLARSAPFYANGVALVLYAKLEYSLLAVLAPVAQVGYYGAAAGIAAVAMLALPLVGTVVFPLLARARERSEAELDALLRRVLELVLAVALPVSLAAALGADVWIRIVFGPAFAPAALPLAILAPTLLATYVNTLSAMALNVLDRAWRVVGITLGGVAVDAALNLALASGWRGASACAVAKLTTELVVCAAMIHAVGWRAFDRRGLSRLARSGVAALGAIAAAWAAAPLGPARIAVAGAAYVALAIASRAVSVEDARALLRLARGDAGEPAAAPAGSPDSP